MQNFCEISYGIEYASLENVNSAFILEKQHFDWSYNRKFSSSFSPAFGVEYDFDKSSIAISIFYLWSLAAHRELILLIFEFDNKTT